MLTLRKTHNIRKQFAGQVIVGKDIIELLSSAMYVDPLTIYREFLQNAADALDEAEAQGLYSEKDGPRIDLFVDLETRTVRIRDNGVGIPRNWFLRRLTSLGASKKRGTGARGFRGVGRLSGLAYCQEMVFRTKATNDEPVYEMHWNCRRLKELLSDPSSDMDLQSMLREIITLADSDDADEYPHHFFEVELRQVVRHKNDLLLNEDAIRRYLAQVGPVPFSAGFGFGKQIQQFLEEFNTGKNYEIRVNGSKRPLVRLFQNDFEAKKGHRNSEARLETFQIVGISESTDAVGWILHHDYAGAIPDTLGIKGLRLRVGNLQVGGPSALESIFPEPRFNSWTIGEVHVLSSRIVPNGRRDDFEQNNHYSNLLNHLIPRAKAIAKECRVSSAKRAKGSGIESPSFARNYLDWAKARDFLRKNASKRISRLHKKSLKELLRRPSPTYAEVVLLLTGPSAKTVGT